MSKRLKLTKIVTIEPKGQIDAANASDFHQQLTDALKSQASSLLLVDMNQVEFIDSAGLMVLVRAFRQASTLGRPLSFCSISAPVRIILELTQLDRVFEIFENRCAFELAIK